MSDPRSLSLWLGIIGALFIAGIILYIYTAICLQFIAKKTSTRYGWLAWIPVANIFLMAMIAKKPWWWALILVLADVVGVTVGTITGGEPIWLVWILSIIALAFYILICIGICQARNKPAWWAILLFIPVVNLVFYGLLAFSK